MKLSPANPESHLRESLLAFYQDRNWQVLPLHSVDAGFCTCRSPDCRSPGKHPLSKNGLKDGTFDTHAIKGWWTRWPFANVGIVTGQNSGFVVLDIDAKSGGFASLADLEAKNGSLPTSIRVQTGGKGLHIYFRAPLMYLRNKAGIRPGVDFRGDGGYVVAPPSRHISGDSYQFVEGEKELSELLIG